MARQATIRGRNGEELHDQEGIRKIWKEYTEQLYAGNNLDEQAEVKPLELKLEPDILEDEVVWAMKQLTNRKAPGTDCIPLELLEPIPTKTLTPLCQRIWRTCKWPREWKRSVFFPIPKKKDTKDCANYRTITLIPHVSEILLKIIQKRLNTTIERELPEVQAGFRKGRGTRDHIANLRWILEKAREYQKKLYMCFIDYSKAFDSIDHDKLWKCLEEMGTPLHHVQLIRSLYQNQEATVWTPYGDTDWFEIGKGTRQGCILSPAAFNMYAEKVMRNAGLEDSSIGERIGGRDINNLRYADDTALLAESGKDLEDLVLLVKKESEKFGLYLNVKKTKIMSTAATTNISIKIDNEEIEVVDDFIFLGSKINRDDELVDEDLTTYRNYLQSLHDNMLERFQDVNALNIPN
ncbi:Hypothetical predicted protein [Octopus vulgaris]|uniref:Reverse transcriptase domain-containing protein n=1 Tax=Octopus vulgaris TaxID=6645 RepID=A0AA36B6K6_OCTVU|nr:Hypothetical predicted protein [Octopus vulgaris]